MMYSQSSAVVAVVVVVAEPVVLADCCADYCADYCLLVVLSVPLSREGPAGPGTKRFLRYLESILPTQSLCWYARPKLRYSARLVSLPARET